MVEPALPKLRTDGQESEAAGRIEKDPEVLAAMAIEFDKLVECIEKDYDYTTEPKHLLRFWYNYNKGGISRRERLRIQINPETHIATIGILGPPHQGYSIYMPKEILEREPIEMLCFILDKYKKEQYWRY